MERDPGDVIDRYTISILKGEGTELFIGEVGRLRRNCPHIVWSKVINRMLKLNKSIWRLESDIGRVALEIRKINSERVKYRNYINTLLGNHTRETKIDHASAKEYL